MESISRCGVKEIRSYSEFEAGFKEYKALIKELGFATGRGLSGHGCNIINGVFLLFKRVVAGLPGKNLQAILRYRIIYFDFFMIKAYNQGIG